MSMPVPVSIEDAANTEDERALLVALRTSIAQMIDAGVPARDMASLSRRVLEINRDIAALDALSGKEGDGVVNTPPDEWDADY